MVPPPEFDKFSIRPIREIVTQRVDIAKNAVGKCKA
jgi:hypothetical protein